jgi:hypothetical protein
MGAFLSVANGSDEPLKVSNPEFALLSYFFFILNSFLRSSTKVVRRMKHHWLSLEKVSLLTVAEFPSNPPQAWLI